MCSTNRIARFYLPPPALQQLSLIWFLPLLPRRGGRAGWRLVYLWLEVLTLEVAGIEWGIPKRGRLERQGLERRRLELGDAQHALAEVARIRRVRQRMMGFETWWVQVQWEWAW
jgi:hypothetical protein